MPRAFHTATLLSNGKVLVTGGISNIGGGQATAELYDASTGIWTRTGSMATVRYGHRADAHKTGKCWWR